MAEMMKNPTVQKWENVAEGECLIDQSPDGKGLWWVEMEEVFFHAGQTGRKVDESKVQRYGMVIGLRSEMVDYFGAYNGCLVSVFSTCRNSRVERVTLKCFDQSMKMWKLVLIFEIIG